MSEAIVATLLRIPERFVGTLVRADFERVIDTLK